MLGGFSSKNGQASFAFPSAPPSLRTMKEWKPALAKVKDLYLQGQYKKCAATCLELRKRGEKPV